MALVFSFSVDARRCMTSPSPRLGDYDSLDSRQHAKPNQKPKHKAIDHGENHSGLFYYYLFVAVGIGLLASTLFRPTQQWCNEHGFLENDGLYYYEERSVHELCARVEKAGGDSTIRKVDEEMREFAQQVAASEQDTTCRRPSPKTTTTRRRDDG
jgi:hypothetical protein